MTTRKMTISIDEDVYRGLLAVAGKRKMSRYISDLVRPHVVEDGLDVGYRAMAADREYEKEAREWVNSPMGCDQAAYDAWFRAKVHEALADTHPSVSHGRVMEEAQTIIDRKRRARS